MSKNRFIISAVTLEGRSQATAARDYNVSKSWVSKLTNRYKQEGEAGFEPRSALPQAT
jgi:transposase